MRGRNLGQGIGSRLAAQADLWPGLFFRPSRTTHHFRRLFGSRRCLAVESVKGSLGTPHQGPGSSTCSRPPISSLLSTSALHMPVTSPALRVAPSVWHPNLRIKGLPGPMLRTVRSSFRSCSYESLVSRALSQRRERHITLCSKMGTRSLLPLRCQCSQDPLMNRASSSFGIHSLPGHTAHGQPLRPQGNGLANRIVLTSPRSSCNCAELHSSSSRWRSWRP